MSFALFDKFSMPTVSCGKDMPVSLCDKSSTPVLLCALNFSRSKKFPLLCAANI